MSMVETKEAGAVTAAPTFAQELGSKIKQFSAALPKHIPQERFARVIMTAVQNNPDLVRAERQSLWNAAMRAAQDGLLPDGREGALVIYNTKDRQTNKWINKVQWMPMIAGLRKKVRNSGEIATWNAQVVHVKDNFEYELGDDPFIRHKPFMHGDPGPVIAAYSVATLKSGEKSREVMTKTDLDKVRSASKSAEKGPWKDWYEEMCRKSVARRHSKILPMSTDLDDLIRRDDDLYDLKGASDKLAGIGRLSLQGKLDALAATGSEEARDQLPAPDEDERPARDIHEDVIEHDDGAAANDDAVTQGEPVDWHVLLTSLDDAYGDCETVESLDENRRSTGWLADAPPDVHADAAKLYDGHRARIERQQAEPDPFAELKDLARRKAAGGKAVLKRWSGTLSMADHDAIEGVAEELRAIAADADSAAGRAM